MEKEKIYKNFIKRLIYGQNYSNIRIKICERISKQIVDDLCDKEKLNINYLDDDSIKALRAYYNIDNVNNYKETTMNAILKETFKKIRLEININFNKYISPDFPVEVLEISEPVIRKLRKNRKIKTVYDFIRLSTNDIFELAETDYDIKCHAIIYNLHTKGFHFIDEEPILSIVDRPIEYLRLSLKSYNNLGRSNIKTIAELLIYSEEELSCSLNITPITMQEIKIKLAKLNLELKNQNNKETVETIIHHLNKIQEYKTNYLFRQSQKLALKVENKKKK